MAEDFIDTNDFAVYSARLDLESALSAPQRCPGCTAASLMAVPAGEQTNFHCASCEQSWHIELGWASSIEEQATNMPTKFLGTRPSCGSG